MAYEHVNGFIEKCNKDFEGVASFYENQSGSGENQAPDITGCKPYFVCNDIRYDITDIFNESGIASDKQDALKITKLIEDTNKRVKEATKYGGPKYFIDSLKFLGNDKAIQFSEGAVLDGGNNQDCVTTGYEPYFVCNGITYKILDIVKKIKLSDQEKITENIIDKDTKITVENIEKIKKDIQDKVTEAKKYASSRHFILSLNFVEKEYKQDKDISFNKGVIYAEPSDNMGMDDQFYKKQIIKYRNLDTEAYEPFFICNGLKYYMFDIVRESNILNNSEEGKLADIINKGTNITVEKINKIKEYIKGKVTEYKEKYTCPKSFLKKIPNITIYDENRQDDPAPIFNVYLDGKEITDLLIKNKVATKDGFVEKIEISRITEIIGGITNEIQKQKAKDDSVNKLLRPGRQLITVQETFITKPTQETPPPPPIYKPETTINNKRNDILSAIEEGTKKTWDIYFFGDNMFLQLKTEDKNVIKVPIEEYNNNENNENNEINYKNININIRTAITIIGRNKDKDSIMEQNAKELDALKKPSLPETDNKISNNDPDKWTSYLDNKDNKTKNRVPGQT